MLKFTVIPRKNILSEEILYYAQIKPDAPLKMNELVDNISLECTVTRHDVKAVISAFL